MDIFQSINLNDLDYAFIIKIDKNSKEIFTNKSNGESILQNACTKVFSDIKWLEMIDCLLNFEQLNKLLSSKKQKLKTSEYSSFLKNKDANGSIALEIIINSIFENNEKDRDIRGKLFNYCVSLFNNPFFYLKRGCGKSFDLLFNHYDSNKEAIKDLLSRILFQDFSVIKKHFSDKEGVQYAEFKLMLAELEAEPKSKIENKLSSSEEYFVESFNLQLQANLDNFYFTRHNIFLDSLAHLIDLKSRGICTAVAYFNNTWYIASNEGQVKWDFYNRKIIKEEIIERFKILKNYFQKCNHGNLDDSSYKNFREMIVDEIDYEWNRKNVYLIFDELYKQIEGNFPLPNLESYLKDLIIKDDYETNFMQLALKDLANIKKNLKREDLINGEFEFISGQGSIHNVKGIHAETIIANAILEKIRETSKPQENVYIGISKPSCSHCTLFIKSCNDLLKDYKTLFIVRKPEMKFKQSNWPVPFFLLKFKENFLLNDTFDISEERKLTLINLCKYLVHTISYYHEDSNVSIDYSEDCYYDYDDYEI